MAIPNLSDIKTRLILFGSLVTGGAVYAANAAISGDHTLWQAGIPALMTIVAGLSNELTGGDLGELIKNRGRARDILENEHLTRVVGLTIAALMDEASTDPRYAADKKRLEAIAKHVKANWKDVPVRHDADFADISSFQLPIFLTGNAETFLQVTALTPETWQFLLNGFAREQQGNVLSAVQLASETVQGVAETLHAEFAHALFNALAADAVKNGEAYSKIVLLMLGEILSTNQQTKVIAEQVLTDTGDLLIKSDLNEKHHEVTWERLDRIIELIEEPAVVPILAPSTQHKLPMIRITEEGQLEVAEDELRVLLEEIKLNIISGIEPPFQLDMPLMPLFNAGYLARDNPEMLVAFLRQHHHSVKCVSQLRDRQMNLEANGNLSLAERHERIEIKKLMIQIDKAEARLSKGIYSLIAHPSLKPYVYATEQVGESITGLVFLFLSRNQRPQGTRKLALWHSKKPTLATSIFIDETEETEIAESAEVPHISLVVGGMGFDCLDLPADIRRRKAIPAIVCELVRIGETQGIVLEENFYDVGYWHIGLG